MNLIDYQINGFTTEEFHHLALGIDPVLSCATWNPLPSGGYCADPEDNEYLHSMLHQTFTMINQQSLSRLFYHVDVVRMYVMKGYDADSIFWHNDHTEGHNMTFVLHMRDLTEETGGLFQMQNTGTGEVHTVVPKQGTGIVFSHQPMFNHRVVPIYNGAERIAIFFDCNAY